MKDLERKLEELYMSDSRSRRVGSMAVGARRTSRLTSLAFVGGVAVVALVAIAAFALLRGGRETIPAGSPSPSVPVGAVASPSVSPRASTTASATPTTFPGGNAGAQPDARYGVIVATGNIRTETDPRGLQEPSLFMTAPTTTYSVSPDGKRIALIRTSQTGQQIVTFTTDRPNAVTTVLDLAGSGERATRVIWAGDGSDSLLFEARKETRGQGGGDNLILEYSVLRGVDLRTRDVREVARISGQNTAFWPLAWLPARQIAGALEVQTLGPVASYVTVRSGSVERTALNPMPGIGRFSVSRDGSRVVAAFADSIRWWPVDQPSAARDLQAGAGQKINGAEFRPGADEIGVDLGSAFEIWTLAGDRRVVPTRARGFIHWRVDGTAAIMSSDPSAVYLVDPQSGTMTALPGGGFPVTEVVLFSEPTVTPPVEPRAPDRVTIGGRAYRVAEASAWRDFMPVSEPGGKPLAVVVRVAAEDGRAFPADITADHLWVYGPTTWELATVEVRRAPEGGTPASQIEVFVNGGPKWDPGTEVEIVVRLRAGNATYLLRVSGVAIQRAS